MAATATTLIGVDCATQPHNVGLALAKYTDGACVLQDAVSLRSWEAITETVAAWCTQRTLIAFDAPLGWPTPLGLALEKHVAGAPIAASANALFRRATDDVVASHIGKRPLDVGADRIARTARQALGFLAELRNHAKLEIPLAWQPGQVKTTSAIEVYPAATLAVRGLRSTGYKGSEGAARRDQLVAALSADITFSDGHAEAMRGSDHVLDAALCCLAAGDFLDGDVLRPEDLEEARREGWIWVRSPR